MFGFETHHMNSAGKKKKKQNKTPGTGTEETYLLNNVEEILTLLRVTHQTQINKYLYCGVTDCDILVLGYVTQIW